MNKLDRQYIALLKDILENGTTKSDRTGTGTISVFGRQIRHKMSDGFPLLTTKRVHFKSIVTELLWILKGDTNIKYLVDNKCNIWNGDAYRNYCNSHTTPGNPNGKTVSEQLDSVVPIEHSKENFINKIKTDDVFAKEWGELGPIYGIQWREIFGGYVYDDSTDMPIGIKYVDQISNLIKELKRNPDSRRLMVNSWNVAEIPDMVLPPCHYGFQVYTRVMSYPERLQILRKEYKRLGKSDIGLNHDHIEQQIDKEVPERAISLKWQQRSVDVPLGLPFNIASYGLLLELLAKEVGMVPDELIGDLGDTHIYLNQVKGVEEQIKRAWHKLPTISINNNEVDNEGNNFTKSILDGYDIGDFELLKYKSEPTIKFPLSN